MGLDMYAFTTPDDVPSIDFDEPSSFAELHYWRKHPNLHGWMENVYRAKGGTEPEFNCLPVRLSRVDIDALDAVIHANALPPTSGFFFGASDGSEKEDDLAFIRKARDALD